MIEYVPPVLRGVREFVAIAEAWQSDFEQVWQETTNILDEQFLLTATEIGISRWERILKLRPLATDTLDERRFAVMAAIDSQMPMTYLWLHFQLTFLCGEDGYVIELDHNNYKLKVLIELPSQREIDAVRALVKRAAPANLVLDVGIRYNPHNVLSQFTHAELAAYTHNQLRNEVFE